MQTPEKSLQLRLYSECIGSDDWDWIENICHGSM